MSCILPHCGSCKFTTDGYCEKHRYYTTTDNKFIIEHIKNCHIKKITKSKSEVSKSRKVTALYNYLKYKKDFMLFYNGFYLMTLKKGDDFVEDIRTFLPKQESDKFNEVFLTIKSFAI